MENNYIYVIVVSIYIIVLAPDIIKLIGLIRKPSMDFDLEKFISRIHIIALIFGVLLSTALITYEVNIFEYSAPIEYSKINTISLKDFNGIKKPNQKLQGGDEFAFITSNYELTLNENSIHVESYFHPARSYVYFDDLDSEPLLRHEMYHFKITELYARQLREKLSNFENIPSKKEIHKLCSEITQLKDSLQKQYDYDTDHGYLLGKQVKWQLQVDSALISLKPYSSTSIPF